MSQHALPVSGTTCMSCWEDIDENNYVEYKSNAEGPWLPAKFCLTCIEYLIASQFNLYKER